MKKMSLALAFTLLAGLAAFPAGAQEMAQGRACSQIVLPPEWAAWTAAPSTPGDRIAAGQPQNLALAAVPGAEGIFAGEAAFTVSSAGTYRFALESAAWIDVVRGDEALTPATFGHGPECSTIRKIVAFELAPGTYTVRITKAKAETLGRRLISGDP